MQYFKSQGDERKRIVELEIQLSNLLQEKEVKDHHGSQLMHEL